jgi:hypothetical protein
MRGGRGSPAKVSVKTVLGAVCPKCDALGKEGLVLLERTRDAWRVLPACRDYCRHPLRPNIVSVVEEEKRVDRLVIGVQVLTVSRFPCE